MGDPTIDEASRNLIASMMQEEEFYIGSSSAMTNSKSKVAKWSDSETEILKGALVSRLSINTQKIHGKDYTSISELFIGSRTQLQIKNRTRYLLQYGHVKESDLDLIQDHILASQPQHSIKREIADDGDINIDLEDDDDTTPLAMAMLKRKASDSPELDICEEADNLAAPIIPKEFILETRKITTVPESPVKNLSSSSSSSDASEEEEEVYRVHPEKIHVPSPSPPKYQQTKPLSTETSGETDSISIDDESLISPFEMDRNCEFFSGETSTKNKHKTPTRYLLIRNHIINLWKDKRPSYISKTAARKGLIGQGDVNAISRVWAFLDDVGVINEGSTPSAGSLSKLNRTTPERQVYEEFYPSGNETLISSIMASDAKRSRRVKDEFGNWINERELHGRVIDHDHMATQTLAEKAKLRKLLNASTNAMRVAEQPHTHEEEYCPGSDPFQLVAPLKPQTQPFKVEVQSGVNLVCDIHAHLAHTEIIGLLGGLYDGTTLTICTAYPCKTAASTQVQCEMDPESEMRARGIFSELGYVVVGWYHSHPTFVTSPSVRDIENQAAYQLLFQREDGIEPFIGMIVNPYPPSDVVDRMHSRFSYVGIGKDWSEDGGYRLPFSFEVTVKRDGESEDMLIQRVEALFAEYENIEERVEMLEVYYDGVRRIDKLLAAIIVHGGGDEFVDKIRRLTIK